MPLLDLLDLSPQRCFGHFTLDSATMVTRENGERVERRSIAVACLLYAVVLACVAMSLLPPAAWGGNDVQLCVLWGSSGSGR